MPYFLIISMSSKTQTVIWVNKKQILSYRFRNIMEMIDTMYILLTKLQRKDMDNCW